MQKVQGTYSGLGIVWPIGKVKWSNGMDQSDEGFFWFALATGVRHEGGGNEGREMSVETQKTPVNEENHWVMSRVV